MKIYTKTGDGGTTSLIGGKRVDKNHPRVEAYGDVDELTSSLGVIISLLTRGNISHPKQVEIKESLFRIQKNLMFVAAYFATPEEGAKKEIKEISEDEIKWLEDQIDKMTQEMPPLKAFVIPGAPVQSSYTHLARTICRRCERKSIAIMQSGESLSENDKIGQKYLNRLSDYLFTLARYFCHITETPEVFWLP